MVIEVVFDIDDIACEAEVEANGESKTIYSESVDGLFTKVKNWIERKLEREGVEP